MDPGTGRIYTVVPDGKALAALAEKEAAIARMQGLDVAEAQRRNSAGAVVTEAQARERGFVPLMRTLTHEERAEGRIRFCAPCGCGSGKKFKHCCFTRAR